MVLYIGEAKEIWICHAYQAIQIDYFNQAF